MYYRCLLNKYSFYVKLLIQYCTCSDQNSTASDSRSTIKITQPIRRHTQEVCILINGVILLADLGSVVQSIVNLTSLLEVKMLTVLVSTISNSQVFLLKKCE